MAEAFGKLTGVEAVFALAAVLGGVLFLARLVLQFLGGHGDATADMNPDVFHGALGDSDVSFKILSLTGLTAFFMMFGLVGLALSRNRAGAGLSVAGAVAAGLASVWLISKIFSSLVGLQSSGTLDLANAVGKGDALRT